GEFWDLPVVVGLTEYKLLIYSANIVVVTSDPSSARNEMEKEAKASGKSSGYKLNVAKRPVVCTKGLGRRDSRWVEEATYLGVQMTADLGHLGALNLARLWTL
ncbi:hypothetical protein NDU88_003134, partial [Pleurodeles waltl]